MMPHSSELICPKCTLPLKQVRTWKGIFWGCDQCNGRAITVELLRRIFTPESINPLWKHAISGEGISSRSCPQCRKGMIEVNLSDEVTVRVDVCRQCHFVWFDSGETESLVPKPIPPAKPQMPQKAREALALYKVKEMAEEARRNDDMQSAQLWGSIILEISRLALRG
jgi:Zn-finger nucleic acid-binding protein